VKQSLPLSQGMVGTDMSLTDNEALDADNRVVGG